MWFVILSQFSSGHYCSSTEYRDRSYCELITIYSSHFPIILKMVGLFHMLNPRQECYTETAKKKKRSSHQLFASTLLLSAPNYLREMHQFSEDWNEAYDGENHHTVHIHKKTTQILKQNNKSFPRVPLSSFG